MYADQKDRVKEKRKVTIKEKGTSFICEKMRTVRDKKTGKTA